MKKITVISGKGGTGKTTVISNLAALAEDIVLADCDVDAPNMHLLLKPAIQEDKIFMGSKIAIKNDSLCINCGKCYDVCRFNAITSEFKINPMKCEGCKVCVEVCPVDALSLEKKETGHIYVSGTKYGPMVHARLKAGAENSGKLVSRVRDISDEIAKNKNKELILIDGSPGIGCPVIASLKGIDYTLIVTEPSLSGLSDLKRILEVTELFGIESLVVINKYDLNIEITEQIKQYCIENNIKVIGKISFSSEVNNVLREGKLLIEENPSERISREIMNIWEDIKLLIED